MLSLILASQSPRRADILSLMGYSFSTRAADADESSLDHESPLQLVARLAQLKAQTVKQSLNNDTIKETVVLAADTIVVINHLVLGKPADKAEFSTMMQALSANTHTVMTAISVCHGEEIKTMTICTDVTFCQLSDSDIDSYWASGEPRDKAGGYGIQGVGGQFVKAINGSYSAVVGLPMVETKELLEEFGVRP